MEAKKAQRSSNLELMRIVLMLLIVAHHLLTNSGLSGQIDIQHATPTMRTLIVFSMWGKVAINPFVIITGYFMCRSRLTVKRVIKLYAQIKFYRIGIFCLLALLGYQEVNYWEVTSALFNVARFAGNSFVSSFFAFYLFIPFYNKLLGSLERREHGRLLGLLVLWQTVVPLLFVNTTLFNEVVWYVTLYVLGAYLRKYPSAATESKALSTMLLLVTVLLSVASVVVLGNRAAQTDRWWDYSYKLVNDSNQVLALATGVACFLFFKNHPLPYRPAINAVASTTFGVLLIHANSAAVNDLLWNRMLHVQSLLSLSPAAFLVRATLMCVVIFVICSALDYLRIRLVEAPFMRWLDGRLPATY